MRRRTLRGAIMVLLVIAGLLALPAASVTVNPVFLNKSLTGRTVLDVSTMHYDLTYNATAGGITWMLLKDTRGNKYEIINNTGTPIFQVSVDGSPLTNGSIEITGESEDQALEALVTYNLTGNETVQVYITFYSWTPVITLRIIAPQNTSNITITIPAEVAEGANITVVPLYTYTSEGVFNTSVLTGEGTRSVGGENPLALAIAGIEKSGGNATGANLSFFAGVTLDASKPASIGYAEIPTDNGTIYAVNATFNTNTIYLRAVVTNYLPGIIGEPPFAATLRAAANISRDVNIIAQVTKYIEQLNSQIDALTSQNENLREQLNNLTKQLDEYKGCEDHYKQELQALEYRLNQLRERLNQTGLVEAGVFIVGIILGILAGMYILAPRR